MLDLLANVDSFRVQRKGHYFLAATTDDIVDDLVKYIGAAIGKRGLHQRCPDYLHPEYRNSPKEKGKFLYKVIRGDIDDIPRYYIRIVALTILPEDVATIPYLTTFSDIIACVFAIVLRTLRTIDPDARY